MNSSLHEGISPLSESYQMVMESLAPLVPVCLFFAKTPRESCLIPLNKS